VEFGVELRIHALLELHGSTDAEARTHYPVRACSMVANRSVDRRASSANARYIHIVPIKVAD